MTEESIYYIVIALYAFYLRSILYLSKLSLPFIEQIVSHTRYDILMWIFIENLTSEYLTYISLVNYICCESSDNKNVSWEFIYPWPRKTN